MEKFKLSVSKGQKKYTIVVSAKDEVEAKEKVHKEWYSILSVEKFDETKQNGLKFLFEYQDISGNIKKWSIVWVDIFKIYLKLKKELWYNIISLIHESDITLSDLEKRKMISSLEEQFIIYEKNNSKNDIKEVKQEKNVDLKNKSEINGNFYLKKELEEIYKLIDFVLLKLQWIINNAEKNWVDTYKKIKLIDIYNSIIKIKKSTNINKLKEIGEIALLKIGEIELWQLEKNKTKEGIFLLKETNKLLKEIGSNKQFIEKEKDIKYLLSIFFEFFNTFIEERKKEKKENEKEKIDIAGYSYLKTVLLLKKYKLRLKENNKDYYKNIFLFFIPTKENTEKIEHIKIKRNVIKQNISILEVKKSWKKYSYVLLKKGYNKIFELLFKILYIFNKYLLIVIIFYVWMYMILLSLNMTGIYNIHVNFNGIFYFIYVLFLYFLIKLSKGMFSLIFNFVFFVFIFIFGVVNF